MINAPVRVISTADGVARVEPTAQSGCGGCASRSSCGVSGLGKYFSSNRKSIEVPCDANVRAGDELQLSMSEGDLLKAGVMAYLLPCVLALAGAGIAASYGLDDAGAALAAANGMAVGFLLIRVTGWKPTMVAQRKSEHFSKGETP
jgi:sigma-E factor negative regulatory protein RseC